MVEEKNNNEQEKIDIDLAVKEKIAELEILSQSLADKKQDIKNLNDKLLRLSAEFENYKKRTIKEKAELIQYSHKDVLESLLPVIDSFEKAVTHKDNDKNNEGINIIYSQFLNVLKQNGLKRMEVMGKSFDPHYHEAIDFIHDDKQKENTVIQELHPGYILNDKVLRPAMVKVTKKKPEARSQNSEEKEP